MGRSAIALLGIVAFLGAGCDEREPPRAGGGPTTSPTSATRPARAASSAPARGSELFPGDSLKGWRVSHWSGIDVPQKVAGEPWRIEKGVLYGLGRRTWIFSQAEYGDFVLTFDVKISQGANGGVGLRFPPEGDPAYKGLEIQIVDHEVYYRGGSRPEQRTGSIYDEIPAKDVSAPVGQWSTWRIAARGSRVTVTINGRDVLDADLSRETQARQEKGPPRAERPLRGRIGFQDLSGLITLRNLRIQPSPAP